MAFVLPTDAQRCTILGKTGSGKTQAGIWQLSERSYTSMPWILLDFKRDKLIGQIPLTNSVGLGFIPRKPGLYIVRPNPGQEEQLEAYLWQIWEAQNIGLFVDEGYMIGHSRALQAILTQGRSLNIPTMILSQRPSWITRFAFSEADFIQVFRLTDERDRKTVRSFVPYEFEKPLPSYYSVWYDVNQDRVTILRPVPREGEILETFRRRLAPKTGTVATATPTILGPSPLPKKFILI
jgi:hypothetical protein